MLSSLTNIMTTKSVIIILNSKYQQHLKHLLDSSKSKKEEQLLLSYKSCLFLLSVFKVVIVDPNVNGVCNILEKKDVAGFFEKSYTIKLFLKIEHFGKPSSELVQTLNLHFSGSI